MRNSLIILAAALIFYGCGKKSEKEEESSASNNSISSKKSAVFNPDSAYNFIVNQVSFGPRIPNTKQHIAAGNYLEKQLKQYTSEVVVQNFQMKAYDGTLLNLKNIVGCFNPSSKKRILLAAHWDTRHVADKDKANPKATFDGANDGASGAAVLLEIARALSRDSSLKVGVDLIFFDGEDYGDTNGTAQNDWCLGSQYWSVNKHRPGYSAYYGILFDMVGARNALFFKEYHSMKFAPSIVEKVWGAAASLGYGRYFINEGGIPVEDDHYYVNTIGKIPMIDIIETTAPANGNGNFADYHHTRQDNISVIDKQTLKAVGQTVLQVLYNE
jgi:glutaminyl-peptide cyclotransferase